MRRWRSGGVCVVHICARARVSVAVWLFGVVTESGVAGKVPADDMQQERARLIPMTLSNVRPNMRLCVPD
jgi:hypothetical protein